MCKQCDSKSSHNEDMPLVGRRKMLIAGAGIAAAPLISAIPGGMAVAADNTAKVDLAAHNVKAWGLQKADGPVTEMQIKRRAVGPHDVQMEILYSGICHSDIHQVRQDWSPATFPIVPGHEIVGRVTAIGSKVTKFKIGDIGGVGCMVDSCGECENCLVDREQNCLNGATFTYNSEDKTHGGVTYGGYAKGIVVTEKFVIRIPPGQNLAAVAPLLCAGITTFSPLQHWKLSRGQRVAVIGFGGLGHMAVKLAVAKGADVTVFTTSSGKVNNALAMGAKKAVVWGVGVDLAQYASSFDLMIAAVPQAFPIQQFMNMLKLDATLVNVGALEDISGLNGMANGFGRRSFAGSMIGGIAETQEVIDFCAARNITADIELIKPHQIAQAFERVMKKYVKFRFVIDMTTA